MFLESHPGCANPLFSDTTFEPNWSIAVIRSEGLPSRGCVHPCTISVGLKNLKAAFKWLWAAFWGPWRPIPGVGTQRALHTQLEHSLVCICYNTGTSALWIQYPGLHFSTDLGVCTPPRAINFVNVDPINRMNMAFLLQVAVSMQDYGDLWAVWMFQKTNANRKQEVNYFLLRVW